MRNREAMINSWKSRISGLLTLVLGLAFAAPALGFTVNVVDHDGTPISTGFSWLLEEDNTTLTVVPVPGDPVVATKSISLDMHKSYAPVAGSGSSTSDTVDITPPDPDGRYILSVLPDTVYSQGGIIVVGDPATVEVVVHTLPIPTAQISILVFKDHAPINNVPDDGEDGLPGAAVTLHDAGGHLMQDAYGNPLGTEYSTAPPCDTAFDPDPAGACITSLGNGIVLAGANGEVVIKNLTPGKYGVVVIPPAIIAPDTGQWIQTSTIEGTRTIDAWVKANEPEKFVEGFGAGFYHAFIGFVNPDALPWAGVGGGGANKITGNLRYNHFSRPPSNQGFFIGPPVNECWVGLNDPVSGQGLYAAPCFDGMTPSDIDVGIIGTFPEPSIDTDHNGNGIFDGPMEVPSSFSIPNVPDGTYELVTWDKPLDALFGFRTVTVAGADQNLGTVLSFRWFGSFLGTVFLDSDQDGYRDPGDVDNAPLDSALFPFPGAEDIDLNSNGIYEPGEIGLPEQNVNIRFRDGTIYQAQPTDIFGGYALEEVFPFFKWLVIEVDFARFKATGMTAAVDDGGLIPGGFDENDSWTLPTFEQLTPQPQAVDNVNTGNNLSRTETGEVLTQAMHLFLNQTNVVDWGKMTYTGTENGGISGVVMYAVTRAENDPRFAAGEPWEPGIPRVQINLYQDLNDDGEIDDLDGNGSTPADIDNYPLGNFPGSEDVDNNNNNTFDSGDAIQITYTDSWDDSNPSACIQTLPIVHGQPIPECADSFGTWNQLRPGVFDGGYAFGSYFPGGMNSGSLEVDGLPAGQIFIVEAATPPGYDLLKEEDKNVDFGNIHQPSTQLLAPTCVGEPHTIPQYLSFQTDAAGLPLAGIDDADLINSPFLEGDIDNAPLDSLVTPFPGPEDIDLNNNFILDAVATQRPRCDRKKIGLNARENAAADFFFFTKVPKAARAVGFVNNDLSAEFNQGSPNFGEKAAPAWIPVAFKDWRGNEVARVYADEFGGYNALLPSTFTVNVPSPTGVSPNMITLILNDPTLPDGSPDPNYNPDYSVTPWTFHYEAGRTSYLDTPLVPVAAFVNFPQATLDAEPRDMTPVISTVNGPETLAEGFGPLLCTDRPANGTTLTLTSAGDTTVLNPAYQDNDAVNPITIIRDYGFGDTEGTVLLDGVNITDLGTSTVDWANDGTTIEITFEPPGVASTGLLTVVRADNARASETGIKLTVTDCSLATFVQPGTINDTPIQTAIDGAGVGDLILVGAGTYFENVIMHKPVQLQGAGGASTVISANPNPTERLAAWHAKILARYGADPFNANEAPGIMVLDGIVAGDFMSGVPSFIDGFAIAGATTGGGIALHRDIWDFEISNNRITNNQGMFAGGITIGNNDLGLGGPQYANNDDIVIRGNWIAKNGGIQGAGGIGIYAGSERYLIEDNLIIGNLSRFSGGGINHVGLSNGGTISHNKILFNEIFYGLQLAGAGDGGGIQLAGELIGGVGAGAVTVDGNQIRGNLAGSGRGGGINAYAFNDTLTLTNNIIANNVAGYSGGGVFLHDIGALSSIVNNTIVNNDATATAALAFAAGAANSTPQPAGLVVSAYSSDASTYPNPVVQNNIIRHNRSFYNDALFNNSMGGLVFNGYWDLAVVNSTAPNPQLNVTSSILMADLLGPDGGDYNVGGNSIVDPAFIHPIENELFSASVIDEGGNSISVRFTPLTESDTDYHLTECSPAIDAGTDNALTSDVDGDTRTTGAASFDIGADEYVATQSEYTQLILLNPVGGEIIPAGSDYWISWGFPSSVSIDHFSLEYSLDGGITFGNVVKDPLGNQANNIDPAERCYLWRLPQEVLANQQVMVKIVAHNAPGSSPFASDTSGSILTIDIDALISPNGGETLFYAPSDVDNVPIGDFPGLGGEDIDHNDNGIFDPASTFEISWQNNFTSAVDDKITLEYQLDGGAWVLIPPDVDNGPIFGDFAGPGDIDQNSNGTFDTTLTGADPTTSTWIIPEVTDTVSALVRLVITKSDDTPILTDVSAGPFTIRPAPPIPQADPPEVPAEDPPPGGGTTTPPTGAGIIFQCPDAVPCSDPLLSTGDCDDDGDGLLRADAGEIAALPITSPQVCLHLAAGDGFAMMADGYGQYMFSFANVTNVLDENVMNMWDETGQEGAVLGMNFPAPLIKLKQFDQVYLTLSNVGMNMRPDLFDPHTVHWHGFPNASAIFDGVPDASVSINMGSSLTYYYNVVEAGTFMYHCHVEASEHMQMGMLGNLYVAPAQDGTTFGAYNQFAYNDLDGSTGYDEEYYIQVTAFDPDFHDASENTQPLPFALMDDKYPMINGRGYPDTVDTGVIQNAFGFDSQPESALIDVPNGATKVLLRISSLSTTSFHTITVLGIPMQVVGQGSRKRSNEQYLDTNSVTLGGGQSVDVLLDVSAVPAGTYFLYVTNLDHLTNNAEDFGGMMTEIIIN